MAKPFAVHRSRKLSLVGGDTLLGREIEDVLKDRKTGAIITTYAASGEGNFGEQEGEAVYLDPLVAHSLEGQQALVLAGSHEGALKAYNLVKAAGGHPPVIDATAQLETQPEARIVAPLLNAPEQHPGWLMVVAHPAASALALTLVRLARAKSIQQAIADVFEPASERGKRGIAELHQQITSLLAFKSLDKDVFDAQLGFNMLSQYGEQAPGKLSTIEERIERHLATLLGNARQTGAESGTPRDELASSSIDSWHASAPFALLSRNQTPAVIPMPSLRLIQAPVFHGYSISLWVQFEGDVHAGELGEALACAQIEVRGANEEAPHNVGAASQSGLIVGDIRIDRNNPHAAWLWIVADNLRLTADAVADLVSGLDVKTQ